ncbi:MAG: nitrogenase iron-molybdenum cofactor biosynthesis protein NifN, partial [Geobacteraceae bacterium]|nr:nitrogenase iron-molybdenum cofactor biosynthesis protein NifN [Geobacteraceae bacterium]
MGQVEKSSAALQINPVKLSQPMGATLAFLGVDRCMPLLHGGQGCASFTKVYFTRHFNEPIALQTTAVTDVVAVLDGGDYSIVEAVKNVSAKVYSEQGGPDLIGPDLIGLYTSGLPETKGDDIQRVARHISSPLVYVNTPDYSGGLESGWAAVCCALIQQLCHSST